MNRIVGVAVGTIVALASGSCRFSMTKAVGEAREPSVPAAETEQERELVTDEIERLDAEHPWGGVRRSLVVAPDPAVAPAE